MCDVCVCVFVLFVFSFLQHFGDGHFVYIDKGQYNDISQIWHAGWNARQKAWKPMFPASCHNSSMVSCLEQMSLWHFPLR